MAFEIARQLTRRGHHVGTLALLDSPVISAERWNVGDGVRSLVAEIRREPTSALRLPRSALRSWRNLFAKSPRGLDEADEPLADEVELDVASRFADHIALSYEMRAQHYDGELVVFRAQVREESRWRPAPPDLGWSRLSRRVSVYPVAGSHLGMVERPHVHELASVLSSLLKNVG